MSFHLLGILRCKKEVVGCDDSGPLQFLKSLIFFFFSHVQQLKEFIISSSALQEKLEGIFQAEGACNTSIWKEKNGDMVLHKGIKDTGNNCTGK